MEKDLKQQLNENGIQNLYAKAGTDTEELTYQINQLLDRCRMETVILNQEQISRKQLISNLSHDLKTPLAGIIGYLEAFENGIVREEEKSEYLEIALKKSYALKHRISELFELVRIDAEELILQPEKIDVQEQLRLIAIGFVPKLEEAGFQYEFEIAEGPDYILADAKAFDRIIQNLVGNVLDHADSGKYLAICSVVQQNSIVIDVVDHGGGIAEKDTQYIFDRLYQADEARHSHGGLGLSITNELVKRMNGSIALAENTEKETIFRLTFPQILL